LSKANVTREKKTNWASSVATTSSTSKPTSRWISHEEWNDRQRKSLCFRCREKWSPNHSCKFRHQQLLLLGEDEETLEVIEEIPHAKEPVLALDGTSLHLSSFS